MKHNKRSFLFLCVIITISLLFLAGCGDKNENKGKQDNNSNSNLTAEENEQSDIAKPADESFVENNSEISTAISFTTFPEELFLQVGEKLTYYVKDGLDVDFSPADAEVFIGTENKIFDLQAENGAQSVSALKNGSYYRIYNRVYDSYISSDHHDNSGLVMVKNPNSRYTVWKAEQTEEGFYFLSDNGYLSIQNGNTLGVDAQGDVFYLVESAAEGCSGSFGILTDIENTYRLDCFSDEQVSVYADDGKQYIHTSFYLYEVDNNNIDYSVLELYGNAVGDTTCLVNGETRSIHVYDPMNLIVYFSEGADTRTARGFNLPDSEVHDRGFYQYQCNPETDEISFTLTGDGKEVITIGSLSYSVFAGGTEAEYGDKSYISLYEAVLAAAEAVKEKRVECQLISVLSDNLIFEDTLPSGVFLRTNGFFGMGDEIMLTYTAKSNQENGAARVTVYPKRENDVQILYLPSMADYAGINLHLPEGAVVSSPGYSRQITVPAANAEIDLCEIFGDMSVPGVVYPIHVTWEIGSLHVEQDVSLIKSANVDSLFFELSEENVDDMVEWLNSQKSHRTKGGNVLLVTADGTPIYEGTIKNLHMRGNSSIGSADLKPSYGFKLSQKANLADSVKAKSWCLVANGLASSRDTTTFGTAIGETLYQRMNSGPDDDYAVRFVPTDLYINGEYRGMYMLTDKVNDDRIAVNASKYTVEDEDHVTKIDSAGDAAIAAGIIEYYYSTSSVLEVGGEGGYVIEICGVMSPDTCGFVSRRGIPVEIKEPGCATREQVQRIAIYYQQFEDALYGENGYNSNGQYYADLIDLFSFGKYYVLKGFLLDMDFFWGSAYMYIDADSSGMLSKLKCCTAWDFDGCQILVSEGKDEFFSGILTGNSVDYKWQFLEHEDFTDTLRVISEEKVFEGNTMSFTDLVEDICKDGAFIDSYFEQVNNAMSMNKNLWTTCSWINTEETSADNMKKRLLNRAETWKQLLSDPDNIGGIPER